MKITQPTEHAIILVPENFSRSDLLKKYGGENLIARSLIALSRSGFVDCPVICAPAQVKTVRKIIKKVRKRVSCDCPIIEKTGSLTEAFRLAVSAYAHYVLFVADKIMHPSLLEQIRNIQGEDRPCFPVFSRVFFQNGALRLLPSVKEKYRGQFRNARVLTLVSNSVVDSMAHVFTETIICRGADLLQLHPSDNFNDIRTQLEKKYICAIKYVEPCWWLKITPQITEQEIKDFFWHLAFKEISGEFSKKVNAVFSKPLSFLFIRYGFTPMAVSWIAFAFLVASSCLLVLPFYWTLVLSGLLWQSAAVLDRCDGEVARMRNYESEKGARFDMITDDIGYLVQFLFLTGVCYYESSHGLLYVFAFIVSLLLVGTAVFREQLFMRRAGYLSRQVYRLDFIRQLDPQSVWTKIYLKLETYGRRDYRGVLYFILTFTGTKILIFWTFIVFVLILGGYMFYAIHTLRNNQMTEKKSH